LVILAVLASPACAQVAIEWRVENPFRLFADPADTEMHRATLLSLPDDQRETPVLSSERALGEREPEGWSARIGTSKLCWSAAQYRHVCPDGADYVNPRNHRVIATVAGVEESGLDCEWRVDDKPVRTASTLCSEPVLLNVPYPGGAKAEVLLGGQVIASTLVQVQDLLIVGIGDSFASGEGNPDMPVRFSRERSADYSDISKNPALAGFPARIGEWRDIGDQTFDKQSARWIDQACHRSLYSHQLRAALQLAIEDPHRAVTYLGYACSGAETTFGLFLRFKGSEWVPTPPDQPQISAIARDQCGANAPEPMFLAEAYAEGGKLPELRQITLLKCKPENARRIDLVLVSIGGNDIGFAGMVANAVLADGSTIKKLGGWFGNVLEVREARQALQKLDERYKSLNRALHYILHVPWSEADRVILTAYPPLAVLEDGKAVCPDGNAGMTVLPDFSLSSERASRGGAAAEQLHEIMRSSARAHNWSFVEAHRRQFAGRGICAGFADHSPSLADDLRLPRKIDGRWQPFNPADWRAYIPRQRWFRTPNDAFMAGNFHVSRSMLQSVLKLQTLSWFQIMLASTYSGAFHPTAEGQAAIADAVVSRARAILTKYADRSG